MFHGAKGPVSSQTGRTIAEKKNDPKSFVDGPAYDYQHGHPITAASPAQAYKPVEMPAKAATGPVDMPAPFTVKGA